MRFNSINPATGDVVDQFPAFSEGEIESTLQFTASAVPKWRSIPLNSKVKLLQQLASLLRQQNDHFARLISTEMGKRVTESRAEIEKCAWVCDFYADQGDGFLAPKAVKTDASDSFISLEPLGTVLGIMPWNFPFWQVFRFGIAALMAGNTIVIKHASNVPQCALALQKLFHDAGFPPHVFSILLTPAQRMHDIIRDKRIAAVTFTGSSQAGASIAATAGASLKKSVLELGGSDAFIVLADADVRHVAAQAVTARFMNAGQSCIAAKRIIVVKEVFDTFCEEIKNQTEQLQTGDPLNEATTLAPMAREDLRGTLHQQVVDSIKKGAQVITGCDNISSPGYFYLPSVLAGINDNMPAYQEEIFGPVACLFAARDEQDAIRIANDTQYGLGASIWTRDSDKGKHLLAQLNVGMGFVNHIVKSDPRLPCGGVKSSGYGRELSDYGIREFVNIKSNWID